jgi:hypothetical protein
MADEAVENDQAMLDRIMERIDRDFASGDMARALTLVMIFGAAMSDANAAQRSRLQKKSGPLLDHLRETGETAPLYRLIHEVHGADWQPPVEVVEWIKNLRKNDQEAQGAPGSKKA